MKTAPPTYTTIPNTLLDEQMPDLSDTAFRIAMIIARQTFGWTLDKDTGMRKKEDWIAYSQLETKTGRRKAAIANALRELEEKDIIEIRSASGDILKKKEERHGKRLFYRLKITGSESEQVEDNMFGKRSSESEVRKANIQKENYTKETNTKAIISNDIIEQSSDSFGNTDINEGIFLLRESGHTVREQQNRYALYRLYKKHGKEKVLKVFRYAINIRTKPYAPAIFNYLDLEEKWPSLEAYALRSVNHLQENKKGVIDARGI